MGRATPERRSRHRFGGWRPESMERTDPSLHSMQLLETTLLRAAPFGTSGCPKVAILILASRYAALPTSSFLRATKRSLEGTAESHFPAPWETKVFCDRCGLNFLPKQSVCTRCNTSSTRHWFQLMSLMTLLLAVASNAMVALLLLPRLKLAGQSPLFQGWMWFNHKAALYGWVPIAAVLLAWDYLVWKEARPKIRGW